MDAKELKSKINYLFSRDFPRREDKYSHDYLVASTVETQIKKIREAYKGQLLSFRNAPSVVAKSIGIVRNTGIMTATSLFKGTYYETSILVKQGGTFVDLDILKSEIGASDRRWNQALEKATLRRDPTVTISVSDLQTGG